MTKAEKEAYREQLRDVEAAAMKVLSGVTEGARHVDGRRLAIARTNVETGISIALRAVDDAPSTAEGNEDDGA